MRRLLVALCMMAAAVAHADSALHPSVVHPHPEPVYAELYLDDADGTGGTDITVTTAGTFYGMKNFLEGHNDGMLLDVSNTTADLVTVLTDGDYGIFFSGSFSGSANAQVSCSAFISGVRNTHIAFTRKLGAAGDVGTVAMHGIDELSVGDYVDLRCTSSLNGHTINFWNTTMLVELIH